MSRRSAIGIEYESYPDSKSSNGHERRQRRVSECCTEVSVNGWHDHRDVRKVGLVQIDEVKTAKVLVRVPYLRVRLAIRRVLLIRPRSADKGDITTIRRYREGCDRPNVVDGRDWNVAFLKPREGEHVDVIGATSLGTI